MPRDPRQIQLEIDSARESLAATLDQIAYRSSPTRLKAQGRDAVQRFLQTPAGQATMGAVGLLVTLVVVQKVRHRNKVVVQKVRHPNAVVVRKARRRND
ncbi:DUF3618 domain-containing protein [Blastococcus sp. VKM Ac-2987]|uniref:DUF3618 domain-containing protein n=1 Tax=Blastococcus sp. VKM Ac-2987 TaxID=3004141 RepID=UPI0022AB9F3F|nr:DUF3618 domain-containing protein [Blastococcus sp. VKM Ac-2987]MCZ2857663.1 DUF3618 domain-containing protein [Blastococcus sp. VKM Ac-2987]